MIRHIVLFKFRPFQNELEKKVKIEEIRSGLENLPNLISELKLLKVGLNVNPDEEYDVSLITEFDSMEALHVYAKHPEHLAVAKKIREVLDKRACVDSVI